MSDLKYVFAKARELLEDPTRWTSHAAARDADGKAVLPTSASAISWCLDGALAKCVFQSPCDAELLWDALRLTDRVAKELYPSVMVITHTNFETKVPEAPVCEWVAWENTAYLNDTQGHGAVLHVLDRAIELAEGK